MATNSQLKQDVICACRILSQQKLVEGFGHVSARLGDAQLFGTGVCRLKRSLCLRGRAAGLAGALFGDGNRRFGGLDV